MAINLGPNTSIGTPPTPDQSSQIKSALGLGNVEDIALSTWEGSGNLSLSANQITNFALVGTIKPYDAPTAAKTTISVGPFTSINFTAKTPGAVGNSITVAYSVPVVQATTTASVSGNALTVTLATKARMRIAGAEPGSTNVTCLYVAPYDYTSNGRPHSENIGSLYPHTRIISNGTNWTIYGYSGYDNLIYQSQATGQGANLYPDGLAWSPPTVGSGYPPSVIAGVSSAAQVINAVNALSILVTALPAGTDTGPVRSMSPVNLIGGENTVIEGEFVGQFYRNANTQIWYRWNGYVWIEEYSTSPVHKSLTAPVDTRSLWFQIGTAKLHVFYDGVWVATS